MISSDLVDILNFFIFLRVYNVNITLSYFVVLKRFLEKKSIFIFLFSYDSLIRKQRDAIQVHFLNI